MTEKTSIRPYHLDVLSLSPKAFDSLIELGIIGRAIVQGMAEINVYNPRDFTEDRYHKVDDEPYGGGAGMILKPEPFFEAFDSIPTSSRRRVLLMTPQGHQFTQDDLWRWSREYDQLVFICGQYEGFDDRIRGLADEEVSLGDYVLTGGEIAAMAIMNGVVRLLPGVVGKVESLLEESHNQVLLEYPHYTRPQKFRGLEVPQVLLSGNHAAILEWRNEQREIRTKQRRPDLYKRWVSKTVSDEVVRNSSLSNTLDLSYCNDYEIYPDW